MYKFSAMRAAAVSLAVVVVAILLVTEKCDGVEDVLEGCNVPPQFWCSSEELIQRCQVGTCDNRDLVRLFTRHTLDQYIPTDPDIGIGRNKVRLHY